MNQIYFYKIIFIKKMLVKLFFVILQQNIPKN